MNTTQKPASKTSGAFGLSRAERLRRQAANSASARPDAKVNRRSALSSGGRTISEMDQSLRELADLAVQYPFRWFPQGKVARICGFSEEVLTILAGLGAPVVARKCNPHLLHKWLEENVDLVCRIKSQP